MSNHKATYTLPDEVLRELNAFVEQRQRSRFVAMAIQHALAEKKKALETAYIQAAADTNRTEETELWETMETEGWDDTTS